MLWYSAGMKRVLTLCVVREDGKVLLGMKKRGFGEGIWNGFGGKVEAAETIEEGAYRELFEEVGVQAEKVEPAGRLTFSFASEPDEQLEVHVFTVTKYQGVPSETEEMRPQWFAEGEIPFAQMWADDVYWVPYVLAGKQFVGTFHFDQPATGDRPAVILKHTLHEVERL